MRISDLPLSVCGYAACVHLPGGCVAGTLTKLAVRPVRRPATVNYGLVSVRLDLVRTVSLWLLVTTVAFWLILQPKLRPELLLRCCLLPCFLQAFLTPFLLLLFCCKSRRRPLLVDLFVWPARSIWLVGINTLCIKLLAIVFKIPVQDAR